MRSTMLRYKASTASKHLTTNETFYYKEWVPSNILTNWLTYYVCACADLSKLTNVCNTCCQNDSWLCKRYPWSFSLFYYILEYRCSSHIDETTLKFRLHTTHRVSWATNEKQWWIVDKRWIETIWYVAKKHNLETVKRKYENIYYAEIERLLRIYWKFFFSYFFLIL